MLWDVAEALFLAMLLLGLLLVIKTRRTREERRATLANRSAGQQPIRLATERLGRRLVDIEREIAAAHDEAQRVLAAQQALAAQGDGDRTGADLDPAGSPHRRDDAPASHEQQTGDGETNTNPPT